MTAAKWCLTTNQLQSGFNCHLHQHQGGRVMEEKCMFFSMCMMEMRWMERVHGQREAETDEHAHAGAQGECHFPKNGQYCLRRGALSLSFR